MCDAPTPKLWRPDASAEDAADAYTVLSREDSIDDEFASYFDSHLAEKYNYPFLTDTIRARKHTFAKARLEHDPYNVNFLEWLMIPVMETTVNEQGQRTSRVLERLSPEEQLDYDTRVLTMKPYDGKAWLNLQGALAAAKPQCAQADCATTCARKVCALANVSPPSSFCKPSRSLKTTPNRKAFASKSAVCQWKP